MALFKPGIESSNIDLPSSSTAFLDVPAEQVDGAIISCFRSLKEKKPYLQKQMVQKEILTQLLSCLEALPEKGDIFRKLSTKSSLTQVAFFNGNTQVGRVGIFNYSSIQMPDTAFLAGDYPEEIRFINLVRAILNQ